MAPTVKRLLLLAATSIGLALLMTTAWVRMYDGRSSSRGPVSEPSDTPASAARMDLYFCPMHPGMRSHRPGDCPICGMRMVPVEEEAAPPGIPPGSAAGSVGKRMLYRSTMNPGEVSDRPGKDSMGMDMVPVDVEEPSPQGSSVEGHAVIRIPDLKQRLIGVATQIVTRGPIIRRIKTVGRVAVDETRLHHVHTKVGGWIEALHSPATGEYVHRGQPLLSIYSPELLASQEEYLVALRGRAAMGDQAPPAAVRRADDLLESARQRLLLFDLTEEQIRRLTASGAAERTVTLEAPISGYVLVRNVTHGERIEANTTLIEIADLSSVWVIASVYEYELPFLRVGQQAEMSLSYLPGRSIQGHVALVYPVLDAATRTVQVRLEFPNPDLRLKPEMYADVELRGDLGERLAVPESAVLSTGTRDIVFVAKGEGTFEPRQVRLGLRASDAVEILDGLSEGERVVTSGNFLIDSESRLKSALQSTGGPPPAQPAPTPDGARKER
jgi:RND family efflux transporter MFP subunit